MKIIEQHKKFRIIQRRVFKISIIHFSFDQELLFFIQEKVKKNFLCWSWSRWKNMQGIMSLLPNQCLLFEDGIDRLDLAQWHINKMRTNDLIAFT